MRTPTNATTCLMLGLLALGWGPVGAQTVDRAPEGLRLAGRVVDAASGDPMVGATVVVEPEVLGAFPGSASSGFAAAARSARTDSAGRYLFTGLAPGPYRLYATRYGYRPFTVTIELGRSSAGVSVALQADPIALEPVRSRSYAGGPYVAADPFGPIDQMELARLVVADMRRSRYLSTDVRELTHADVVEGVTLGEPDLFRALQRLPGVTTRSDYSAALWTRGAPWSQTRVYYDGIPLFNPLHALGMISGISSSAVGTVWFHPGVRSAGIGEGAAGVVDLRSRPATGLGELNVQADASLATAGLALDQRVLDGRAGWLLTGRTSYLDWLADLARRAGGQESTSFPYHFNETSGRVDARLSRDHTVEASWLWEGDQLTGPGTPDEDPLRATWGNALGQATWAGRFGDYRVQYTIGGSQHHGLVRTESVTGVGDPDAERRSETLVSFITVRGSLWPDDGAVSGPRWSLGYEVSQYGADYIGPVPLPVPRGNALRTPVRGSPQSTTFMNQPSSIEDLFVNEGAAWDHTLPVVGLWGERTWRPTDAVTLRTGLRAETGAEIADAPVVRLSPRATLRVSPIPELGVSIGAARVFQYAQTVAPGGVHMASLVSTDAWLLAGEHVPAVRSDMATAGIEARVAAGRIIALNGFARYTDGMLVPNPIPGPVLGRSPAVVIGQNTAVGLEASVRQLTGPLTGSLSYSLTRSRMTAAELEFPAAADRTHVLNATGMARPVSGLRVGAAFTAATGVPYTRSVSDPSECTIVAACDPSRLPWAGEPNANRGPVYASLDLLVDWAMEMGGMTVGVYGQLRNVLGRENATVYAGGSSCLLVGCSVHELRNAYEEGVPRLPVIGVRVHR